MVFIIFLFSQGMKNSLKVSSLVVLSMLALAGCNGPATTSTTTPTTSSTTSTTTTTTSGETKTVATPSGVEKLNTVEAMGNKVTTYSVKADSQAAFDAQAKMVKDAGWNGSYQGMTAPISAAGTVTQTFSGGKKILVLATMADPMSAGMTLVTMTESADPLAK